jgi:hypothetical protein
MPSVHETCASELPYHVPKHLFGTCLGHVWELSRSTSVRCFVSDRPRAFVVQVTGVRDDRQLQSIQTSYITEIP